MAWGILIFSILISGLGAADLPPSPSPFPSPNSEIAAQPGPPTTTEVEVPGLTSQMKADFLERYRLAIQAPDSSKYLALICLDQMDENSRIVAAHGAERSLAYVGGHLEALSFDWTLPDPEDTQPFERNGFRYHPNLQPVVALRVNIKRDPGAAKDLPTALQPTLGIKDGQLLIVGRVHEKLPSSPPPPPPPSKDDE